MIKKNKLFSYLLFIGVFAFILGGLATQILHAQDIKKIQVPQDNSLISQDLKNMISTTTFDKPTYNYKDAYKYFIDGKYNKAFKYMEPLAKDGNTYAILVVGYLYEFGLGVHKNYKIATLWYYYGSSINKYNQASIRRGLIAYKNHNYKDSAKWMRMGVELRVTY